jgi:phosphatidylserine decarboxylase
VLDPRDVKFFRNVTGDCWRPGDDPFAWRDRLPLARVGLGELVILSSCLLLAAAASLWVFWPLAVAAVGLAAFVVSFFRDPRRAIPSESGVVVSPADGKVVTVREIDADDYLGGPAVEIGIFLSVFNVHVNRSPAESRVMGITYTPGKFLNALRPRSAQENERLTVRLQELAEPHRRYVVRQITGAIARRIVCWARPGDRLARGARFGMIKLGSRTELVLPRRDNLVVDVRVGQRVKAGISVVARYQ